MDNFLRASIFISTSICALSANLQFYTSSMKTLVFFLKEDSSPPPPPAKSSLINLSFSTFISIHTQLRYELHTKSLSKHKIKQRSFQQGCE
jgi:hypothetical protein